MITTIPFQGTHTVEVDGEKVIVPLSQQLMLQSGGAVLPVGVTHPQEVAQKLVSDGNHVPSIQCSGMIDTGASHSAITPQVAHALNLVQVGFEKVTSVQDEQYQPAYLVQFHFHWGNSKEVKVVSCPMSGYDCLIGRDILMDWNITYDGKDGFIIICD